MLTRRLIVVFVSFILDICFGDPRWLYHPVCIIGNIIGFLTERLLPKCGKQKKKERIAGFCLVIAVLFLSVSVPFVILYFAYKINTFLGLIVESFWCYQLLAAKSLRVESKKVYDALKVSLAEGRKAVSMIVGRDTEALDEIGVIKATVETVAENTSDGVVAPLLFMVLFGAVGAFFYKAVNTMDSMIGYQNDKYQYFGTAAAGLDDICNWIPARISAIFMILAAGLCKENQYYNRKDAWRIWRRDRTNHKSPNSAQTEAACAGALQIQLAGDAYYFGKRYKKPFIGDCTREIELEDINRAGKLMYVTSVLVWIVCMAILQGIRVLT
jgi:adenosylcobinamide-phosphate synthase